MESIAKTLSFYVDFHIQVQVIFARSPASLTQSYTHSHKNPNYAKVPPNPVQIDVVLDKPRWKTKAPIEDNWKWLHFE